MSAVDLIPVASQVPGKCGDWVSGVLGGSPPADKALRAQLTRIARVAVCGTV
ncbi:hypothetical protein GCM10020229_71650 [Kitasatospora albolonga]